MASHEKFCSVNCPQMLGIEATRETDTMDTFYDSSWYFMRFCDAQEGRVSFLKAELSTLLDGGNGVWPAPSVVSRHACHAPTLCQVLHQGNA